MNTRTSSSSSSSNNSATGGIAETPGGIAENSGGTAETPGGTVEAPGAQADAGPIPNISDDHTELSRDLGTLQIAAITVSGIIGMGLFVRSGRALQISGPGGTITAFAIVGIVAISVLEGLSEMLSLWPIPNAMVEFTKFWVDEDLGAVVGVTYWYSYGTSFYALILGIVQLFEHWGINESTEVAVSILAPIAIIFINLLGVNFYGWTEVIGAGVKLIVVLMAFTLSLAVVGGAGPAPKILDTNISNGYHHREDVANNFVAFCVVLPIVAFAFTGVEIVAVTASEAKSPQKSIQRTAKYIAYFTFIIYMSCVIAFVAAVNWNNPDLPGAHRKNRLRRRTSGNKSTESIFIIAIDTAQDLGCEALPDAMVACLILVVFSTANSHLYVSSRTLYGLASGFSTENRNFMVRLFAKFSKTTEKTTRRTTRRYNLGVNVPAWAVIFSAVLFTWVPLLRIKARSEQNLMTAQDVAFSVASTGIILVWASQCLAFLCFRAQMKKYGNLLEGNKVKYHIWKNNNDLVKYRSICTYGQPVVAIIGGIGSIFVVLGAGSANLWDGEDNFKTWGPTYIGPIAMLLIFIILKALRWLRYGTWSSKPPGNSDVDTFRWNINQLDLLANQQERKPRSDDVQSNMLANGDTEA